MTKFIIVDGNSLLFRSYYATAYASPSLMQTSYGLPTNAVFAFGNMMAKILSSIKEGDGLFVGFDADGETFRKAEFSSYKANRKPTPEALVHQFAPARELLDALGIIHYEEHGIEADDICGTLAKKAAAEGYEVKVYTSDRDYLQLVDEHISVELLKTGLSDTETVTPNNIVEKFGFTPLQTIDYKALRGDTSDNLPGIPGVGEKTAVKLLQQYGTFDNILEHADEIKGKLGENIRNNAEMGKECYRLATIITDAALPFGPSRCLYHGYLSGAAKAYADKYELKTLLQKLPASLAIGSNEPEALEQRKEIADTSKKEIALFLEFKGGAYHKEEPAYVGIYDGERGYFMETPDFLKDPKLKEFLSNKEIITFDSKALTYYLRKKGLDLPKIKDDILLATYILDSATKSDSQSIYAHYGEILPDEPGKREAKAAFLLPILANKAVDELESSSSIKVYREIELPLALLLSEMERKGFPASREEILALGEEAKAKRDRYAAKIKGTLGDTNPNSPRQLQEALFGENGLFPKKAKGTGSEVLNRFTSLHPVFSEILGYRKYAKLYSTYVEGLLPYIDEDGMVRTYFNQAMTATGRLSSSSPNLQNLSGKDEEGAKLREAFHYEDGRLLLSLDYSQIELRVLAALSGSKAYQEVFANGRDIHAETARRIYGKEEVDHDLRRKAKAVNFAIIYGSTVYGLSEQINGSLEEAQNLINGFYSTYPEIKEYLEKIVKDATSKGFVTTLTGRRRYLSDLNSPNYIKREAARRAALNAPIQGSAADLLKMAMLKCRDLIKEHGDKIKMVLTVHDEIIFAGTKEDLEEMLPLLKDTMENVLPLGVPLKVEGKIGENYFASKE